MGLFSTRKEHAKEQSSVVPESTRPIAKVETRKTSSRIPKLATLFADGAEDEHADLANETPGDKEVSAPTVDMDDIHVAKANQPEQGSQLPVRGGMYGDDDRNFSAVSACVNQRAMARSQSRHEALLKRSDSISLMAKRSCIKRSVSRKIARSESRRQSMGVNSVKEAGEEQSNVKKSNSSILSTSDGVDVEILMSDLSMATAISPSNLRSPEVGKQHAVAKNSQCQGSQPKKAIDFEVAYGEDDAFLVEEATRKEFSQTQQSPVDIPGQHENLILGAVQMSGTNEDQLNLNTEQKGQHKTEEKQTPELKRGRPRKRPPPLLCPGDGKSASDPASDWSQTGVFGMDGGFTTGGFKITSEGMVGKPPIATREDSDPHNEGDIPQSAANLVIVRSLREIRAGPTIGAGAAGRVYLAEHMPSKRTMAMKVVNVYDKEKRNQLLKELETLSTHISRYLVRFYGAFYDGSGAVHIALEFMDHGCLSTFVHRVGPIPERVVQMIALDCLRGLRFLHRHHVLHRDFKTANILLSRRLCCAKLSDFGLARDLNPGVSRVDTFVGTVAYMSPERLQGSKYTYASDIWALGVSMVECLLGRYPFNKPQSYFDYIEETMTTNMWSGLRQSGISVSDDAKDFVKHCTFTDPNRRSDTNELIDHPWLRGVAKDTEVFGSWLDHCRIRSMAVPARGQG